jgi:hypothetical protein
MNAFILTVVTYLAGSAWGPQVAFTELSSRESCEARKQELFAMVNELNKTNLIGGRPHGRELIVAKCAKK